MIRFNIPLTAFLAIAIHLFTGTLAAQTGWQRYFPPSQLGQAIGIETLAELPDGGFLVVGASDIDQKENFELRTDPTGHLLWIHSDSIITPPEVLHPRTAVVTPYGAVQAWVYAPDPGWDKDVRLYGFNSDGHLQWHTQYVRDYDQFPVSMCRDGSGNLLVTGQDKWYTGPETPFLLKTDSLGNAVWFNVIDLPFQWRATSVTNTVDGNGYLVYGLKTQGTAYGILARVAPDSTLLWWRQVNSDPNGPNYLTTAQAPDGEIWLFGNGNSVNGLGGINMLRLNAQGDSIASTFLPLENGWFYEAVNAVFDQSGNLYLNCGYAVPPFPSNNSGQSIIKITPDGTVEWTKLINSIANNPKMILLKDGCIAFLTNYQPSGQNESGLLLMKICSDGSTFPATIEGRIVLADDLDCDADSTDIALENGIYSLEGTAFGTSFLSADQSGAFAVSVDTGYYIINGVAPGPYWEACDSAVVLGVLSPDTTVHYDLVYNKRIDCPYLTVDIGTPFLKYCAPNTYFVRYSNTGTATANDAYVEITLDPALIPQTATIPFSSLGSNVYRFPLGQVEIGQAGTFSLVADMNCNEVEIGQTLCAYAHIYPDSLCLPDDGLWSGASLRITVACDGDSVRFNIKNKGMGNMPGPQDFVVIEDIAILKTVPFNLNAGQELTVPVPSHGGFLRGETRQVPYHPGISMPSAWVEGCNGSIIPDIANQFPQDDADDFTETDCHAVEGITGATEKSASPEGIGSQHLLEQGLALDYVIQFQNTTQDTIYTVTIRDSLPVQTDWSGIQPGVSSHPYQFNLYDGGVASFTFPQIQLPPRYLDSVNSYGFVKFRIKQLPDLADGTVLENSAQVYFDFQEAVPTNTVFHTIGKLTEPPVSSNEAGTVDSPGWKISPNPANNQVFIECPGAPDIPWHVKVFRADGMFTVVNELVTGNVLVLPVKEWPSGVYFCEMERNGWVERRKQLIVIHHE